MKKEFGISSEYRKRFTVGIVLAFVLGLLCLGRGAYLVFVQADLFDAAMFLLSGLLFLLWVFLVLAIIKTTRLVLTSEKIEFHSPGLALITSWSNVDRIGTMSDPMRLTKYDALILREAAVQGTTWWLRLLTAHPEREIPMSVFWNWRRSEVGQEIRRYAPHLFTDDVTSK